MWYAIGLNCVGLAALWWKVSRFEKALTVASDAAHNHFEALRKVRQRGS